MKERLLRPDYLFEVSWEICNKVGGIHTVISTKALTLVQEHKNNLILIGPDVWRDTESNPEFIEDPQLFTSWKNKAAEEGLRIRVGRWNIEGKPLVVIVDFTPFFTKKDEIFKEFWEDYKLDSITGQWDYVEPALFGYAAGKVIESFTRFQLTQRHRIVAQFHEWMTGMGLLYLKKNVSQIGSIFTTHATVMGRCLAGNNVPLYSRLDKYNADQKAIEFNVVSKQSLEKVAALEADCYTTVSDLTAKECAQFHGKKVDIVTPNGFENSFVPEEEEFKLRRIEARVKFYEVAEALLAHDVAKDALIVGISGRYEFKNKGIDVFIDALAKLNQCDNLDREVLAFILIPGAHHGPRKDVFKNLQEKENENVVVLSNTHITHYLNEPEYDPILNKIKSVGLYNSSSDRVKIFFVPCYLNGNDGIFNMPYWDLLIGMDLSVFPSYYEPWGYTPLESLAFHVPTITTTLAGFGLWVNTHFKNDHPGIKVIERTDDNDSFVVDEVSSTICHYSALSLEEQDVYRKNALEVSRIALWENLIDYYREAYHIALQKVEERTQQFMDLDREEQLPYVEKKFHINKPNWVRLLVQKNIPEKLTALDDLSKNLWWCWNPDAVSLFESIDPKLWEECEQNPILFLDKITFSQFQKLENDEAFIEKLAQVHKHFTNYMGKKIGRKGPKIAYLSMEFGLHSSLKLYSGGLGVLAGDYLKEASDRNVPIVGIGLFYRYGYFTQQLSSTGQQIAAYDQQNFAQTLAKPVRHSNGKWKTVGVAFPGRIVNARIWRVDIGRTELYLLDTDYEDNQPQDRNITHHLYGGDWENRFKQEMILGIGGIRALEKIGIHPDVYHLNEGHAAFAGLERLRQFIVDTKFSFAESLELVRASSLFTTHTPVPAGHDSFPEDMLRTYMSHYPERLGITWEQFMDLGKLNPGDESERFSMSFLAANLSQEVNGVSWLHGDVSRKMFANLWPGYFPSELHLGYVTNGVHYPTWTSPEIRSLIEVQSNENGYDNNPDWNSINNIPDAKLWGIRNLQRGKLIEYIRTRLVNPHIVKYENPRQVVEIQEKLRDNVLTIGFARRFATYKRAHLLIRDLERLNEIINNEDMPVQFIFAGKAHPNDKAGQDLIRKLVEVSKRPEFIGKFLFLQNYNMDLAKKMVQGVDIWLNTPTRPLEASGTSGMKSVMNGGLHFSVLDGWWVEGYKPGAGWALPQERTYFQQEYQDELDAEIIYSLLENEIIPKFYNRNEEEVPVEWVSFIKKSISEVASNFSSTRMMIDYEDRFYHKLYLRSSRIQQDDCELAKRIASWKRKVTRNWDSLEIITAEQFDTSRQAIVLGKEYVSEVVLDLGSLNPDEVGVELVIAELVENGDVTIKHTQNFDLENVEGQRATYKLSLIPNDPGVYDSGIRVYAKNKELPHRMDFTLVRWV
ncbi:MAG: alpha-glucan family phosphorylase [Bacteroidetes bacterium HGW-Bacteroidetes-15]|nr:MAG: alpha-glucan family phosphorylase [Bacteroidetes bacterium HGW-Bacteroidetes-15]